MTSSHKTLIKESFNNNGAHHCIRHYRNVLKSNKNSYKHKCKHGLKKKLKSYKVKQDGKEDQDIIDVSNKLVSLLFVKSPNKRVRPFDEEVEEPRPTNYLFRMVKRQTSNVHKTSIANNEDSHDGQEVSSHKTPTGEEKKQTNAFKLLMDSRNKSIGTNSPGKEKSLDETEVQEMKDTKGLKAKRQLLLQKMAESKGSIKKQQLDELQENIIKKKMKKRAEKLKEMLKSQEAKTQKQKKIVNNLSSKKPKSPMPNKDLENKKKGVNQPKKNLQLVSIFSETIDTILRSPEKQDNIWKEDEEFIKKLSPSLRKKESMLSYFRKVEKDSDNTLSEYENENIVIKVKLGLKPKKKGKKKKLSLTKSIKNLGVIKYNETDVIDVEQLNETDEMSKEEICVDENSLQIMSKEEVESTPTINKGKRKRKHMVKDITNGDSMISDKLIETDDARPKRLAKRPIKYNEDFCCSSSDEELFIFTPKKKKKHSVSNQVTNKPNTDTDRDKISKKSVSDHTHKKTKERNAKSISSLKSMSDQKIIKSDQEKSKPKKSRSATNLEEKRSKRLDTKPVKLAPIFASKPDPAAIEARQKFLHSGVPEKLKKVISKQKDNNDQGNAFTKVVHIQQLDTMPLVLLPLSFEENSLNECLNLPISEDNIFSKMLNFTSPQSTHSYQLESAVNAQVILQHFKEVYPRFPVYRTYRLFRGKKKGEFRDQNVSSLDNSIEILNFSIDLQNDNPDQLTWCDKYKGISGREIIGNFDSVQELQRWLVTWTENVSKFKITNDSDSSDFYQSDTDSRDSMRSNNNLLILSGPVGSGKTSSVYAVAAELAIKVIEVNASSKRTGKIMLQDLHEATQSHKVNRATVSAENSQKFEEIVECVPVKEKKRGRPKKIVELPGSKKEIVRKNTKLINSQTVSQDSMRTAMSLILIDDADVIFEQDDGFCSAIMQLAQSSKRPVILITETLTCPHLQKFVQYGKTLKMQRLLPNMLGTWLDILCLADSGSTYPGLGAKVLNFHKGDIRKAINTLHFYLCSQEQSATINCNSQTDSENNDIKVQAQDESSSMSWVCSHEDKNITTLNSLDSNAYWNNVMVGHMSSNQFTYPKGIFNVWYSVPKVLNISDTVIYTKKTDPEEDCRTSSLESISNVLDSISLCDAFSFTRQDNEPNIASHPWSITECDSVSELENVDSYNRNVEIYSEICFELVDGSIRLARENLGLNNNNCKYDLDFPGMAAIRQRERTVSRHINLTTHLSPQSSLDRKALALDYWSFCRNVCRTEKSKTDTSSKRNNRYCHYLKSLSPLCKSDTFDKLANSLRPRD